MDANGQFSDKHSPAIVFQALALLWPGPGKPPLAHMICTSKRPICGTWVGLGMQAQVPVPSPTVQHPDMQNDEHDSCRGLVFKGTLANMPLVASLHHSTSGKTIVVCTCLHPFVPSWFHAASWTL